jgi:hypothetical protein
MFTELRTDAETDPAPTESMRALSEAELDHVAGGGGNLGGSTNPVDD